MEKHFTVKAHDIVQGFEYEFCVTVTNDDRGEVMDWFVASFDDHNLKSQSASFDEFPTAEQIAEFVENLAGNVTGNEKYSRHEILVDSIEEF